MARNPYGGKDDVMVIASHFVQDYYDKFAGSFSILQTMYGSRAKILVTGAANPGHPHTYDGQKEIAGHFEALGQYFSDQRKVCIKSVDAVSANYGSVVVTVEGSIYTPASDTDFSSVFVLQTNNQHTSESFHVVSEALRFHQETKNAAKPVQAAKPVPAAQPAPVQHAQQTPIGVPAPRSAVAPAQPPTTTQRVAPAPTKTPQKVFEEDDEEHRRTPPPQAQAKSERKPREEREPREKKERKPREEKKEDAPVAAAPVQPANAEKKAAPAKKEDAPAKPAKKADSEEKKAPAAPAKKEGPKPNRFVVLRNVPKKTQIDDCVYYCQPFGKLKGTEWLGQSHAVVEFKYLADAEAIVAYNEFTMFSKAVRVEFYIPKVVPVVAKEGAAPAASSSTAAPAEEGVVATKENRKFEKRERKPAAAKPADKEEAAPAKDAPAPKEKKDRYEKPAVPAKPEAKSTASVNPDEKPKREKKPVAPKKDTPKKEDVAAPVEEKKEKWSGWNKPVAAKPTGPAGVKK